jgi:O-antigen ligase
MTMTLRLLLAAMIIYLPNQLRFPPLIELKGLNALNLMFFAALFLMMRNGVKAGVATPMKGSVVFLVVMVTWALLVGVASDSSQWANDVTQWKTNLFYPLLFFLFFHAASDKREIEWLFRLVMVVAFVAALQAVRQGLDYGIGNYNETHRASGPFGVDYFSANRAAAFYSIFVPVFLVVALLAPSKQRLLRAAAAFCYVIGVLAVFFTYSRQAFGILALTTAVVALRRSIFVAVLAGLAIVNYQAWAPGSVADRVAMTNTSEFEGERKLDESTESRFVLWEGAAMLIGDAPWGIGLNQFKRRIGQYVPPNLAGFDAHNNYVLIATEGSLIAALALVMLLLRMLWLGFRMNLDDDAETRMYGMCYFVAVIGVITSNFYGSRFFDGDIMGSFWILSGLVARYAVIRRVEQSSPAAAAPAAADDHTPAPPAAPLPYGAIGTHRQP